MGDIIFWLITGVILFVCGLWWLLMRRFAREVIKEIEDTCYEAITDEDGKIVGWREVE